MPILANAKKALRSSKRKTAVNQQTRSKLKTAVDSYVVAPAKKSLDQVYSMIDKAVKRNVIQANKGARMKQRMSKLAKA